MIVRLLLRPEQRLRLAVSKNDEGALKEVVTQFKRYSKVALAVAKMTRSAEIGSKALVLSATNNSYASEAVLHLERIWKVPKVCL